jgi:cupin 2 domain-containing protein
MVKSGNLLSAIAASPDEVLEVLASTRDVKIERIVSTGQASPPGFWYDQEWLEWIFLIAGSAGLMIEGETEARLLKAGDYIEVPAHVRHRVEWTDVQQPTVWLAVHVRD